MKDRILHYCSGGGPELEWGAGGGRQVTRTPSQHTRDQGLVGHAGGHTHTHIHAEKMNSCRENVGFGHPALIAAYGVL